MKALAPYCKPGASVCGLCGCGRVVVGGVIWGRVCDFGFIKLGNVSMSCCSSGWSGPLVAGGNCGGEMVEWPLGGSSSESEGSGVVGVVGFISGPGSVGILRFRF